MRIWQEFYCNDCHGYFRVKVNMGLNHDILVVCPECGRKHPRRVQNGCIVSGGLGENKGEELCPPKSAYSKEPFTKFMRDNHKSEPRESVVIKSESDLIAEGMVKQSWWRKLV